MFIENLPNKGSLLREFGARKPTHLVGTYPFPQHVMLPPPPPPGCDTGDDDSFDDSLQGPLSTLWIRGLTSKREFEGVLG